MGSEGGLVAGTGSGPRVLLRLPLRSTPAALRTAGRAALGPALGAALGSALLAAPGAAAALGGAGGPRVVAAGVAAATTARGARDLGGGVAQARADLVDVELHDRALLTLSGLEAAGLEPALRHD